MESKKKIDKEYHKNPKRNASLLSHLAFCWILPLFAKGYKKDLQENDLFEPLDHHTSHALGNKLETEWKRESVKDKPSFLRSVWKIFGLKLIVYGIFVFALEAIRTLQPIFLHYLLEYFKPGQTSTTKCQAYIYATIILLITVIKFVGGHHSFYKLQELGMMIRIASGSLIYRKTLRLSRKATGNTTTGQIVNILASDLSRFDRFVLHVHNLWMTPVQVLLVFVLMYIYLGITSTVGIGFMILYIPLQMYLAKQSSKMRLKTTYKSDERIRFMNEIVHGIQVIKMYTWEKPFAKLIEHARRMEVKYIRYKYYIKSVIIVLSIAASQFTIFITILTFVLLGNKLTASYVFVMYSFFDIIRVCLTKHFPFAIAEYADIKVSIARIEKFLLHEEKSNHTLLLNGTCSELTKNIIKITKGTAKWHGESTDNTLTDVDITIKHAELIAVIGPVGSGKSSLLQTILRELPLQSGLLYTSGTISYASQEAWLFGATVRQNILFGQSYEPKRYNEVIRVCALDRDFESFPYGDKTLVGERGIMVSGGQKARINLARAIYKEADIYLLDDPLSAVDTHVGKRLFNECIMKYLKGKCVILVTHQLQYLKNVEHIILIENGVVTKEGSYSEIQTVSSNFTNTLNVESSEDVSDEKDSDEVEVSNKSEGHEKQMNVETRKTGRIKKTVYKLYVKAWGSYWITSIIAIIFVISQLLYNGADYFLSYWVNSEQRLAEEPTTPNESNHSALTREDLIYIYTGITLATLVLALLRSQGFYRMCMNASIKMHDQMFDAILYAPMHFFYNNPSGRILNRFSKDAGALDEQIPNVFLDTVKTALQFVGISIMVGIVNPLFFFITGIIIIISYVMRIIYLSTTRDIKRLESVCKSPVFTHVSASLQGLTTIRAFDAQSILISEFDNYQNSHSSAWFMLVVTSRAFGFYLDLLCSIYIGLVIFSFLVLGTESYAGNVGLAITQSLSLTSVCQWGMRQWSELENQMTSVERITEYINVEQEPTIRSTLSKPLSTNGKITFKSVSMRYSHNTPLILKHLSFEINPREKIGIVGRTGAGKSSLIAALFQLTPTEGDIYIDDVNISELSLKELRSNISIIPQDPVLFSGTIRKNLDPFDEFADCDLWNALEEVKLKAIVANLPSGLASKMEEGGANFSVGQRQLMCLARAIVRKNKILILDEATANVDPYTDQLIQQTIRRIFLNCTVLTIAHRLNTIMDSDKVMVLDEGVVIEFDHPHLLLQNKNGVFTGMLQQMTKAMDDNLRHVAEKAYFVLTKTIS